MRILNCLMLAGLPVALTACWTCNEPRRVCRRLFGLSHAAIADVLVMA